MHFNSSSSYPIGLSVILLVWIGAHAEDFTTRSGQTFHHAEVIDLSPRVLTIKHDGGVDEVPLESLPEEVRERFSAPALFHKVREQARELEALRGQVRLEPSSVQTARPSTGGALTGASEPSKPAARPTPPIESLPPLAPTDVVDADDMVNHFATDARAAEQRYKGKTMLLRGAVDRFEPILFLRSYNVLLRTGDRGTRVICRFSYAPNVRSVITRENGDTLVSRLESGQNDVLMRVEETVTIRGVCKGMERHALVFTNCELAQ